MGSAPSTGQTSPWMSADEVVLLLREGDLVEFERVFYRVILVFYFLIFNQLCFKSEAFRLRRLVLLSLESAKPLECGDLSPLS